jgi:hypothetical protein
MALTFVRVAEVFCRLSSGAREFQRRELAGGYMNVLFFKTDLHCFLVYFVTAYQMPSLSEMEKLL